MSQKQNGRSFSIRIFLVFLILILTPQAFGWNPFSSVVKAVKSVGEFVGGVVGAPVGGFVGAATAPTIRNAEAAGMRLSDHLNDQLKDRITQANQAMAERIAQFDGSLKDRILQADAAAKARIDQLNGDLKERVDQLDGVVTKAVNNVDVVLKQNIDHLDQVAETRIGTLDVVASKASLSFEDSFVRVIRAACILVFISFLIWKLYVFVGIATSAGWRAAFTKSWDKNPLVHLLGAAVAAVAVYFIIQIVPGGAGSREKQLADVYASAYDRAYSVFDLDRARYLASQLEAIDPTDQTHRARFLKTDLIRDVFSRPALVQTMEGLSELYAKVSQLETYDHGDDPDVPAVKAYVQWQIAADRKDELEAVKLAATSVEVAERTHATFVLLPIVTSYLDAYVSAPLPETPPSELNRLKLVTSIATARLKAAGPETFPALAHVHAFDEATQSLDVDISDDYRAMIFAHAAVVRLDGKTDAESVAKVTSNLSERTRLAGKIVDRWNRFDDTLRSNTFLQGSATPLAAFGLNDAVYVTASWFKANANIRKLPPLLVSSTDDIRKGDAGIAGFFYAYANDAERATDAPKIQPMRIQWRDRFASQLGKFASGALEIEEFQRYKRFEIVTRRMELDLVRYYVAAEDSQTNTWTRLNSGVLASQSAAALGWYVSNPADPSARLPLAKVLFDDMLQNKLDPATKAAFDQSSASDGRKEYETKVSNELERRRDTTL